MDYLHDMWGTSLKYFRLSGEKSETRDLVSYDFKGFAEFRLSKYKEAEADYEAALSAGEYTAEEAARTTKLLFRVAAQNLQLDQLHAAGFGRGRLLLGRRRVVA